MKKHTIPISVHLRYLYQDKGIRGKEFLSKYPMYSKASVYRHAAKPIVTAPLVINVIAIMVGPQS